jgi:hypothetical protein
MGLEILCAICSPCASSSSGLNQRCHLGQADSCLLPFRVMARAASFSNQDKLDALIEPNNLTRQLQKL